MFASKAESKGFRKFFEWTVPPKETRSKRNILKNVDFSLWGNRANHPNTHLKLEFFPHFSSLFKGNIHHKKL